MTTNALTLASDVATRLAARAPGWTSQTVTLDSAGTRSAPPSSASSGVALSGSPTSLVAVALRRYARGRTVRVTPTFVIGDTWTVTVNGGTATYDTTGDATATAALTGLVNAINADADVNTVVTAVEVDTDSDGVNDAFDVISDTLDDFSFDISDDGTSTSVMQGDYASAIVVPSFGLDQAPGSAYEPPAGWFYDADQVEHLYGSMGRRALRLNTGGFLRGHLHFEQLVGVPGDGSAMTYLTPTVHWGPGLSETS